VKLAAATPTQLKNKVIAKGGALGTTRTEPPASDAARTSDAGFSTTDMLVRVDELLEARYGSASLGNKADPLDELIFIVLSAQTRPNGYERAFNALKQRFAEWDSLLTSSEGEVETLLRPAGLSRQKTKRLRGLVQCVQDEARRRAGDHNVPAGLGFLRSEDDATVERFLTSLPGVSVKTARCVMMYSLGREVFPVDTHILRILARMGLARSLHRKQAGDPIQDLVPRTLRRRLHINLIHHGREVCKPRTPGCGQCSLVSFCESGLQRLRDREKPHAAVDLFAGPGGLSAGFRRAGFTVVFAAEKERYAAQTYRLNHAGVPTFEVDVATLDGSTILSVAGLQRGQIDALLGGPPCQGYSQAGKRNPEDPANSLYREFVRLGEEVGARLLVMENVPGVRNVGGKAFVEDIEVDFRSRGFEPRHYLLNSADYGVPQKRRRILFLAAPATSPIVKSLSAPPPTHAHDPSNEHDRLPSPPNVTTALSGLPVRRPGEGEEVSFWNDKPLFNHVAMRHSAKVVSRIKEIPSGGGAISYRRLHPAEPGRTIIAGHRALPVHPVEHRTITVREAARLQGFDDSFRFIGPRAEQPLQVANAVPPPLGEAIARRAAEWLGARTAKPQSSGSIRASQSR